MRICFFDKNTDLTKRFAREAAKRNHLARCYLLDERTVLADFLAHLSQGGDPLVVIGDFLGAPVDEEVVERIMKTLSAVDPKTKFVVYSTIARMLKLSVGQALIGMVQKTAVVMDIMEILLLFQNALPSSSPR